MGLRRGDHMNISHVPCIINLRGPRGFKGRHWSWMLTRGWVISQTSTRNSIHCQNNTFMTWQSFTTKMYPPNTGLGTWIWRKRSLEYHKESGQSLPYFCLYVPIWYFPSSKSNATNDEQHESNSAENLLKNQQDQMISGWKHAGHVRHWILSASTKWSAMWAVHRRLAYLDNSDVSALGVSLPCLL